MFTQVSIFAARSASEIVWASPSPPYPFLVSRFEPVTFPQECLGAMIFVQHLYHFPLTLLVANDSCNSRLRRPPDEYSFGPDALHAIGCLFAIPGVEPCGPGDNFEIRDLLILAGNQFHNILSRIAVIVPRTVNPEPSPTAHRALVRVDDFPGESENIRMHSSLGDTELHFCNR
jgi:hypothetical protein